MSVANIQKRCLGISQARDFLPVAIYRMIHFPYVKSNHIMVFIKYKNTSKETLDVILFEDTP